MSSFHFHHKFHNLPALDGMDVVLGMDWLQQHDVTVHARAARISIPTQSQPLLLCATPASSTHVDNLSRPAMLRSLLHCSPDDVCFLGYIKELLTPVPDPPAASRKFPPPAAASPPMQTPELHHHELAICAEFRDVLRDEVPPGLPPERTLRDGRPLEHAIPMKPGAAPAARQPYRLSEPELAKVRAQLSTLPNQGWIRPSLSPWGALVLFQRKKDGKLRMCIDYGALNHQTLKAACPMPRIEELLEKLRDYQVVSKIDLKSGFHQVRM
jgi:hypothetical protein